ncbi:unnamed protein product [Trifolium pratense]|uniref:Uncharacterized protein n=1 Tax=Trifolium pratense TaxID=57577 RepID=A0ACB0KFM8_TRIPR|nr:unnamed protein product [Trifolium pratense]
MSFSNIRSLFLVLCLRISTVSDILRLRVAYQLKGFLCNQNRNSSNKAKSEDGFCHMDVLEALYEAMRKTDDAFFNIINEMVNHNPVLAMIGSCVLVMLIKGEDVYLINNRINIVLYIRSIQMILPRYTKGRVKGYLNITRAFGAEFLKQDTK